MGVLDDMAQQARLIAATLKVNIPSQKKTFLQRQKLLNADFERHLALFVTKYKTDTKVSDAAKTALDNVHEGVNTLETDIRAASKAARKQISSVDWMVTGLQTTITNIQTTTDFDSLDASSKQLLMDFSREYKSAYAIMWAKVALVIFLCWHLRQEWFLIIVAYLAFYILWMLLEALIKIFKGIFKKKPAVDLNAARCANVTAADAVGSGCPITKAPSFTPCSGTTFGCCPNGLAAPDDKSTCGTLDCWKTSFGCCLNGTAKTSATDTCDAPPQCLDTGFGCCPNGMPRDDEAGTNCTLNSACGYSAFGCCPDGTLRDDALGSNCEGGKPQSSMKQLSDLVGSVPMNRPYPASSIEPPNPFLQSNGSINANFTSGLNAVSP